MHEMIPSASLAGEVLLDGDDIYDPARRLTDARRQIGMVFQKPNPFPAMSIYDNVVASLRLTGTKVANSDKDAARRDAASARRGCGTRCATGSGSRAAASRAVSSSGSASPGRWRSGPGPAHGRTVLGARSRHRRGGSSRRSRELVDEVTIVIVTHNMQQAARVSQQCAFFLAEQGTPGVIVEHGSDRHDVQHAEDQRTLDYVHGRFG